MMHDGMGQLAATPCACCCRPARPCPPPPSVRAGLEAQPGDEEVRWFSFDPEVQVPRDQLSCYLTHTTAETHRILRVRRGRA